MGNAVQFHLDSLRSSLRASQNYLLQDRGGGGGGSSGGGSALSHKLHLSQGLRVVSGILIPCSAELGICQVNHHEIGRVQNKSENVWNELEKEHQGLHTSLECSSLQMCRFTWLPSWGGVLLSIFKRRGSVTRSLPWYLPSKGWE